MASKLSTHIIVKAIRREPVEGEASSGSCTDQSTSGSTCPERFPDSTVKLRRVK
jgi:hypothetical protein